MSEMSEIKEKLLDEALDKFHDMLTPDSPEFKTWWRGWINRVQCELYPDPWMNEPLTPEELALIEAAEAEILQKDEEVREASERARKEEADKAYFYYVHSEDM